jgi:hypothetical protein
VVSAGIAVLSVITGEESGTLELFYSRMGGVLAFLITFDEQRFAHETIDGETMIIDTVRGHLIIVSGGGSFILELIRGGTSHANLLRDIGDRYGHDASEGARVFLDELAATGALVEIEQAQGSSQIASGPTSSDVQIADWPTSLALPVIERYEDIAEIIAMDPIHDVDVAGWPRKIV